MKTWVIGAGLAGIIALLVWAGHEYNAAQERHKAELEERYDEGKRAGVLEANALANKAISERDARIARLIASGASELAAYQARSKRQEKEAHEQIETLIAASNEARDWARTHVPRAFALYAWGGIVPDAQGAPTAAGDRPAGEVPLGPVAAPRDPRPD